MKKIFYFTPFLLAYSALMALPEGREVVMGNAEFHSVDSDHLQIKTSDKAIIDYREFNVGTKEHIEFVQPSSKSTVLNRIKGGNPSQIFGKISANGKVFLVNPNGVYFGPHAQVNASAFLVSTLAIREEDFLGDKLHFSTQKGSESSSIVNEGTISVAPDGFVAFFAPVIENRGSIYAKAGKVVLASSEKVTVDFAGDGLVRFSLDGELKEALIENYGQIEAASGTVEISLRAARHAVRKVVNTDGMLPVNDIEESNGIIRLVSKSAIKADDVKIQSNTKIQVEGNLDVTRDTSGGSLQILGETVELVGAMLDASGPLGGGNILIGGDYQGLGEIQTAENTSMDSSSLIYADALVDGNGGKVILWADDTTVFNGKIFARGAGDGSGGFVETSGKDVLSVEDGTVDTSAPFGEYGQWLLDPNAITISTGGGGTLVQAANCSSSPSITISPSTLASATTNVILCAQRNPTSSITITSPVTITNPRVSLSLVAGSTGEGPIRLNNNLTTAGNAISLTGIVSLGANVALDTTYGGKAPVGGDIFLSSTVDGTRNLALNGGASGNITLGGDVGLTAPLLNFTVTGSTIAQNGAIQVTGPVNYTATSIAVQGNITTKSGNINLNGAALLANAPTFDTTNKGTSPGAAINFAGAVDGNADLALQVGSSNKVSFKGAIGDSAPLASITFNSVGSIELGGSIAVTGTAPLLFPVPLNLIVPSSVTSHQGDITFAGTVDGSQPFAAIALSGEVVFQKPVGSRTPLASFTAQAETINLQANVTTSGGAIEIAGAASIASKLILDATNSGKAADSAIALSGSLDAVDSITLIAGASGSISLQGEIGKSAPLTDLTIVSCGSIELGASIALTGDKPFNFTVPVTLVGPSSVTSGRGDIAFSSVIDGTESLALHALNGTVTLSSGIGQSSSIASLQVEARAIDIQASISANGGAIEFQGPVLVAGQATFETLDGTIAFSDSVEGSSSLSLQTGTSGHVLFAKGVGAQTPFAGLQIVAGDIQMGGSVTTSDGMIDMTGALNLMRDATFSSSGSSIRLAGSVDGSSLFALDADTVVLQGSLGSVTPLSALSVEADSIQIGGDITTSAGRIAISGPLLLTADAKLDSTQGGSLPSGADITFSHEISGAYALKVQGGDAKAILLGAVGETSPLASLSVEASSIEVARNVITTGSIEIAGSLLLDGSSLFDTTGGGIFEGADIRFAGAIDGSTSLALQAGTSGSISFGGTIGQTAPLRGLAIMGSNPLEVGGNIRVTGESPLAFSSQVILIGPSSIISEQGDVVFYSTVDGTYPLSVNASSAKFGSLIGNNVSLGSLLVEASQIELHANVTTSGTSISFKGPVLLAGDVTLDTTGSDISFFDTIDGSHSLTLQSGPSGHLVFGADVGASSALTLFTVYGESVNLQGSIATQNGPIQITGKISLSKDLVLDASQGDIILQGDIDGSYALAVQGNDVSLLGTIGETTPLSSMMVTASTLTQSKSIQTIGSLEYVAQSSINIQGNIVTSGPINISGPLRLSDTVCFDTTFGGFSQGSNISFSGSIDGEASLALHAGASGVIALKGPIGEVVPLQDLSFVSAESITLESSLNVVGLNPLVFKAPVTKTGTGKIVSQEGDITFNAKLEGDQIAVVAKGAVSFVSISALSLSVEASQIHLSDNIDVASDIAMTGPVLLATDLSLKASDIHFTSSVDGAVALHLQAGHIALQGSLGTLAPLKDLSIVDASLVEITGDVTIEGKNALVFSSALQLLGPSTIKTGGDVVFEGIIDGSEVLHVSAATAAFKGTVGGTTQLSSVIIEAGSIAIENSIRTIGVIELQGPVVLARSPLLASEQESIFFSSTLDGAAMLTLETGPSSTVTFTSAVGKTTPLTGLFIASCDAVVLGGDITVTGENNLSFLSPLQLTGSSTITSLSGSIAFQNTLVGSDALTLQAGAIDIHQNISVKGSIAFLGATQLHNDLSFDTAADITFGSTVQGAGLSLEAKNVTLQGAVDLAQLQVTAEKTSVFANVVTSGGFLTVDGDLYVANDLLFDTKQGDISFGGKIDGGSAFSVQAGNVSFKGPIGSEEPLSSLSIEGSRVHIQDTITTAGGSVSFGGSLLLASNSIIDTTNSGKNETGADIVFKNQVDGDVILTLIAGSQGVIALQGATSLANVVALSSNHMEIGSDITLTNPLVFSRPVSLTGASSISSLGSILFASTVDGPYDLALTADSVTFVGSLGKVEPLKNVLVKADQIVMEADVIASGNVDMLAPVLLTNTLSLTAQNVHFSSQVDGNAALRVAAETAVFGGAIGSTTPLQDFSVVGCGSLQIASDITVTGTNPLVFSAPIELLGSSAIVTGGDIAFESTVDGSQIFQVKAASVSFKGALGAAQPLSSVVIEANITTQSDVSAVGSIQMQGPTTLISSATFSSSQGEIFFADKIDGAAALNLQASASATITIQGPVGQVNPLTDFAITGCKQLVIGSDVTVTGDNPLIFSTQLQLIGTNVITSLKGAVEFKEQVIADKLFTVNAETIGLNQSITVNGSATFVGPTTLYRDLTVDTTAGNGDITFTDALQAAALNLQAGSGRIALQGSLDLTSLKVAADVTSLFGNVTAKGGSITVDGDLYLANDVVMATGGGDLIFAGKIDGKNSLAIQEAGTVSFTRAIGSKEALKEVSVAGSVIHVQENVLTEGKSVSFEGQVLLLAGSSIDTTNSGKNETGADITFKNQVDGSSILTLMAGSGGVIALQGATSLANVVVQSADHVEIASDITVTNSLVFSNPVSVTGDSHISSLGSILFTSTVDGPYDVSLTADSITFAGSLGKTQALKNVIVKADQIKVESDITASGNVDVLGPVSIANNPILTAQNVQFSSMVDGNTTLKVAAETALFGGSIAVQDFSVVDCSSLQVASDITLTGTNPLVFSSPLKLLGSSAITTSGDIAFESTVDGSQIFQIKAKSVSFKEAIGSAEPLSSIMVDANTTIQSNISAAGFIQLQGSITLIGDATFSSSQGNIFFADKIDGAAALNLQASASATITLQGPVGQVNPLTGLVITGCQLVVLDSDVTVTGDNPFIFSSPLQLTGANVITSLKGSVEFREQVIADKSVTVNAATIDLNQNIIANGPATFVGPAILHHDLMIDTTAGNGDITFTSTLQAAALKLNAGSGRIELQGPLDLTSLQLTADTTSFFGGIVTKGGSIQVAGDLYLANDVVMATGGGDLVFAGKIDGKNSLAIQEAGTVSFNRAIGSKEALKEVNVAARVVHVQENVLTEGKSVSFEGQVLLLADSVIDTTNGGTNEAGADIAFKNQVDGSAILTLVAGSSGVIFLQDALGDIAPLRNLCIPSAHHVEVSENITVTGHHPLRFSFPVLLKGASQISSSGSIVCSNEIDGSKDLILKAGSISLQGAIGSLEAPSSLQVEAGAIEIKTNVIVAGSIDVLGLVSIGADPILKASNIHFSSKVDGEAVLTLAAETIVLENAVGGSIALKNLSILNCGLLKIGSDVTVIGQNPLVFTSSIQLLGESRISSQGNIVFEAGVDGNKPLHVQATGATFRSALGASSALESVNVQASHIDLQNDITAVGPILMQGPVYLTGRPALEGSDITFLYEVDGSATLNLQAGPSGIITFARAIGQNVPLIDLSIVSCRSIALGSDLFVAGEKPLAFPSPVFLKGASRIKSDLGSIVLGQVDGRGPLLIQGRGVALAGLIGSETPLSSIRVEADAIDIQNNITVLDSVEAIGPAFFSNNPNTFINAKEISFEGKVDGETSLLLRAEGVSFKEALGSITPLTALAFGDSQGIEIGGDITIVGKEPLIFPSPLLIKNDSKILSQEGEIVFESTLNGEAALVIQCKSALFKDAMALRSLEVVADHIDLPASIMAKGPMEFRGPAFLTKDSYFNAGLSDITFFQTVVGPVALTLAGSSVTALGNIGLTSLNVIANRFTQNGAAQVVDRLCYAAAEIALSGDIQATGGDIEMQGAVSLSNSPIIEAAGSIAFVGPIDGNVSLTLQAAKEVSFAGGVGQKEALTSLEIIASKIAQQAPVETTGSVTYRADQEINLLSSVTTRGARVEFIGSTFLQGDAAIDATGKGSYVEGADILLRGPLNGASALTLSAGSKGTLSLMGSVGDIAPLSDLSISLCRAVEVSGDIKIAGSKPLVFAEPLILLGSSHITSNQGAVLFNSAVDGAASLKVTAQAATFSQEVGSNQSLTSLDVVAKAINIQGDIRASGAIDIQGPLSLANDLVFETTGSSISFAGKVDGDMALTLKACKGEIFFQDAVGSLAPLKDLVMDGSMLHVAGDISVTGANPLNFKTEVFLTGASSISSNGGLISFERAINGAQSLRVVASNAHFKGGIGEETSLASLIVEAAANLEGRVITTGSVRWMGSLSLEGESTIDTTGRGSYLQGSDVAFFGDVNGFASLKLEAGAFGKVSFAGKVGEGKRLTSLSVSGREIAQAASCKLQGSFQYRADQISIFGDIETQSGNIAVEGDLLIGGNPLFDTTQGGVYGGGDITFSGRVDGDAALTLQAGNARIILGGAVGAKTALAYFTSSADLIDIHADVVTRGGYIQLIGDIVLKANAKIDTTNGGMLLNGADITFQNRVGGPHNLSVYAGKEGDVFFKEVGTHVALSSLSVEAKNVHLAGDIVSQGGAVWIGAALDLMADSVINTFGGDISFGKTVNGPYNLTLLADTGSVSFLSDVGGQEALKNLYIASAKNLTLSSVIAASLATSNVQKAVLQARVATAGTIELQGEEIVIQGPLNALSDIRFDHTGTLVFAPDQILGSEKSFVDNGPGSTLWQGSFSLKASDASFKVPVALAGKTDITATSNNISFESLLDGAQDLTLIAQSGNIVFSGPVGSLTPLGFIQVESARDVKVQSSFASGSFEQKVGTGRTSFEGATTFSSPSGFTFVGKSLKIESAFTATQGAMHVQVEEGLEMGLMSLVSLDGCFMQSGPGLVHFAGGSLTANQRIECASAVTLSGDVKLSAGSQGADIVFLSALNGPGSLQMGAGTGNITFTKDVGSLTALQDLKIIGAQDISAYNITAGSIRIADSNGTATFEGTLSSRDQGGISLEGHAIVHKGTIVTHNGGNYKVSHSGPLTFISKEGTTLSGSYIEKGTGSVSINGTIVSTGKDISFAGPVQLTGPLTLQGEDISFFSSIDGREELVLNATDKIAFHGNIGEKTPLKAFTIESATRVFSWGQIEADFIVQNSGKGIFHKSLITTTSKGISLTGSSFAVHGLIDTTVGQGPIVISNAGSLVVKSGAVFQSGSTFTQIGSGSTLFAGSIIADEISFIESILVFGSSASLRTRNGKIHLKDQIDGSGTLILDAGSSGDIIIEKEVGSTVRLGSLVIEQARNVIAQKIIACSIRQEEGHGLSIFGEMNASGEKGIILKGNEFVLSDSITITGGEFSIANRSMLTCQGGVALNLVGSYRQQGPIRLQGSITTKNFPISFEGPVTLLGPLVLDTGDVGADVRFVSTVDGAFDINIAARSGDVIADTAIGSQNPIGRFNVESCRDISLQKITSDSLLVKSASGNAFFEGEIVTRGIEGVALQAKNISFLGDISAKGPISLDFASKGQAEGRMITASSFRARSEDGAFYFGGSLLANSGDIVAGSAFYLLGPTSFNTSAEGGSIQFLKSLDGAFDASFTAGNGTLLFDAEVGAISPLKGMQVTSASHMTAKKSVFAESIVQKVIGASIFEGDVSTTGALGINITAHSVFCGGSIQVSQGSMMLDLALDGAFVRNASNQIVVDGSFTQMGAARASLNGSIEANNISFNAPINLEGPVALSASSNIQLSSVNGEQDLVLEGVCIRAGSLGDVLPLGAVTLRSSGDITVESLRASVVDVLSKEGSFTQSGNMQSSLKGSIAANAISFSAPISLEGPVAFHANSNIQLSSVNGEQDLALEGACITTGPLGDVLRLGAVTLRSSGDITVESLGVTSVDVLASGGSFIQRGNVPASLKGSVTANNISFNAPIQVEGPVSLHANSNIQLSSVNGEQDLALEGVCIRAGSLGDVLQLGTVTLRSSGDITVESLRASVVDVLSKEGSFTQSGNMQSSLKGSIAANAISFSAPISLEGPVALSSGSNIQLSHINGNQTLALESTHGSIRAGLLGAETRLGAVTLRSSGDITVESLGASVVDVLSKEGSFIQTGNVPTSLKGSVTANNISFNAPIQLEGPVFLHANSNIQLSSVNGEQDLALEGACITTGPLGDVLRLGAVTLRSSGDITVESLGVTSVDVLASGGSFTQRGNVPASLKGSVTANNISFNAPIQLEGPVSLHANSNIQLSHVNGNQTLALEATHGSIRAGLLGAEARLGAVTIRSGTDVSVEAIGAALIDIVASGGSFIQSGNAQSSLNGSIAAKAISFNAQVQLEGPVSLHAEGSIELTSVNGEQPLTLEGARIRAASLGDVLRLGAVTLRSSGDITVESLGASVVDVLSKEGSFIQTGNVPTSLKGSVTANNISFNAPIQLEGPVSLHADGSIELSNVNGQQTLSLEAVHGSITAGFLGDVAPLGVLTIRSRSNVAVELIAAEVIDIMVKEGTFVQNSKYVISLTGSIAADSIRFNSSIYLKGSLALTAKNNIELSNVDGHQALTLEALQGGITADLLGDMMWLETVTVRSKLDTSIKSIIAEVIDILVKEGTLTLSGELDTNHPAGIALAAPHIVLNGPVRAVNGRFKADFAEEMRGSMPFSFRAGSIELSSPSKSAMNFVGEMVANRKGINIDVPVFLVGESRFDTRGSNGDIHFLRSVDGAADGIFSAGSGDIVFDAAIGSSTPLRSFAIESQKPFTLRNGLNIAGDFKQTGTSGVNVGGSFSVGGSLVFTAPVTLIGNTILDTHTADGDIMLSSTVDGPYELSCNAGKGNLTFAQDVGAITRLKSLTIASAQDVNTASISAGSIAQTAGFGKDQFGNLETDGMSGISLKGSSIAINGNLITTQGGPVTIEHAGELSLSLGDATSITGSFTEKGTGSVVLAGTLALVDQDLFFTNPVALDGPVAISTGTGTTTIKFSGALYLPQGK